MAELQIAYEPRPQFIPFHQRSQRFACLVCHRRAGKTVACVNELIHRAIYTKKADARYGYVGPFLKQAKDIAWMYLKRYTEGIVSKVSESELSVTLKHNGAKIRVYGADNPDSFRGVYFDGIVLDEYGDMSPSVWGTILLPTLADRNGWAVFIGTFKGRNHFYKVHRRAQGLDLVGGEDPTYFTKHWFSMLLKASESGILSEDTLRVQRMEMDADEYDQEFECNPNAVVKGTYYAGLISQATMDGRIYHDSAVHDAEQPVVVFTDLGIGDSTAMWFAQARPDGYALIDYEEQHSKKLDDWVDLLKGKGYNYEGIYLPHDAKSRTFQTGRSTFELFADHTYPTMDGQGSKTLIRLVPKLSIQHGIDAARHILPHCYFGKKTENGVEALRAYKREWDDERGVFSDNPNHDWSSHGSDAFRYFALMVPKVKPIQAMSRPSVIPPGAVQYTLNDLFEDRERHMARERY